MKTLLNVQGLQPTASETFDLRELDLKVHERWDAARAKQQKHFAKKSLEDGRSKTQAMRLGSGTDLGARKNRGEARKKRGEITGPRTSGEKRQFQFFPPFFCFCFFRGPLVFQFRYLFVAPSRFTRGRRVFVLFCWLIRGPQR